MKSNDGNGAYVYVYVNTVPAESITRSGFKNFIDNDIQFNDTVVCMFILNVVSFCFTASHVYLDEGTPFNVILTISLILAVSIETGLLNINIPYNFPFCEKVYRVYFNG